MLRKVRTRSQTEHGFTLVELLVVTTIIGMLAAVGLPAFLGPQKKGHDGAAKSNARNAVTAVDVCFAETEDFARCDTRLELESVGTKFGVSLTDTTTKQKGAVSITAATDAVTIVGYSQSGNEFTITKTAGAAGDRTCTTAGQGGCRTGGVW